MGFLAYVTTGSGGTGVKCTCSTEQAFDGDPGVLFLGKSSGKWLGAHERKCGSRDFEAASAGIHSAADNRVSHRGVNFCQFFC